MTTQGAWIVNERRKILAEITNEAFALLSRELGVVDTIRFVNQYTDGSGDYTAERESHFGMLTLDEITAQIKGSNPDSTA